MAYRVGTTFCSDIERLVSKFRRPIKIKYLEIIANLADSDILITQDPVLVHMSIVVVDFHNRTLPRIYKTKFISPELRAM